MTKFPRFLAVLTLIAVLVACGETKKNGGPAGRGGRVSKATDDIPTTNAKGMYVDHFRFGDVVDADGIVAGETSVIPPGSSAAVSLYVRNVPSGTQIRFVWSDAAGKAATAEDVKAVGDKGFVTFKQPKPLPEGNYRVDMYYKQPNDKGWNNLGGHEFRVGRKS